MLTETTTTTMATVVNVTENAVGAGLKLNLIG